MKNRFRITLTVLFSLSAMLASSAQTSSSPLYLDPSKPVDDRVDDCVAPGRPPAAHVVRPPAETGAPALERLVMDGGVSVTWPSHRRAIAASVSA